MKTSSIAMLLFVLVPAVQAGTGTVADEPIMRAMQDELHRSIDKLALPGSPKPYFLSYALWDTRWAHAVASFGATTSESTYPHRSIDVVLRVGDYAFDNSNVAERSGGDSRTIALPIEDNYDAIRHDLWLATDAEYKHALETLERKQAVAKQETKAADEPASFSKEPPSHLVDAPPIDAPDSAPLAALAKKLSAVFRANPDVYAGTVEVVAHRGRHYFVSSEGSASVEPVALVHVDVDCETRADDGMTLRDSVSFWARTIDQLPPEAEMVARVEQLSAELSALRKAPVTDDYGGPILFTGVAAGQLVRAMVAEQLSGTPAQKSDRPGVHESGESELAGKVNQRIFPAGVSIVDDPTAVRAGKTIVVGGYAFDEEGVPAQKVAVVENGAFKRFLMSRTPRAGVDRSNGHGRSATYSGVRARPTNVFVTATGGVSDPELRRRGLALAKQQDLPYVLVVERFEEGGGDFDPATFDATGAILPRPAVVRRLYRDGHNELVRGATLPTMQLRALKDIVAFGATPTAYHYLSSGLSSRYAALLRSPSGFPISIVAPALLVRDADVKKPRNPQRAAPIVPRPR